MEKCNSLKLAHLRVKALSLHETKKNTLASEDEDFLFILSK